MAANARFAARSLKPAFRWAEALATVTSPLRLAAKPYNETSRLHLLGSSAEEVAAMPARATAKLATMHVRVFRFGFMVSIKRGVVSFAYAASVLFRNDLSCLAQRIPFIARGRHPELVTWTVSFLALE